MKTPNLDLFREKTGYQIPDGRLFPFLDIQSTAWQAKALCRDSDPELYFQEGNATSYVKASCKPCPVRSECLEFAQVRHIDDGIWGGLSGHERRRLREGRPTRWTRYLLNLKG